MKSYRDHTLGAKERASLLLKEMSQKDGTD